MIAGSPPGPTIFGMFGASDGSARSPGDGSALFGALERIVIQPEPVFLGSVNVPVYVAPAASSMTSPGEAELSAFGKFPPAETLIVDPVGATRSVASRTAGGAGAANDAPCEPPSRRRPTAT